MKATDYIYTTSGKRIDPKNPHADLIDLHDIAYGLSGIQRYNAQTRISVLRHSIAVANCCQDKRCQHWALLHDAPEAYVLDVPVPLQFALAPDWKISHDKFETLINAKFNCNPTIEERETVRNVDKLVVEYEMSSRERFELGSRMSYPLQATLTFPEIRALDDHYLWGLSDMQLISLYITWIRELASDAIPKVMELTNHSLLADSPPLTPIVES